MREVLESTRALRHREAYQEGLALPGLHIEVI